MTKTNPAILAATTIDLSACNGPAIHFANLLNQLSAIGHPVTTVFPSIVKPPAVPLATAIVQRPVFNPASIGLPRTLSLALAGRMIVPPAEPSVAYVRASPLTTLARHTMRVDRFRSVIVEYNGWLSDEAAQFGYPAAVCRWIERLQVAEAKRANRIRVVTAGLAKLLVDSGVEAGRIRVIGNGTDPDLYRPMDRLEARRDIGLCDAGPVLGFLGSLWSVVDWETLLAAVTRLQKHQPGATLIVVGEGAGRAVLERPRDGLRTGSVRLFGAKSPAAAVRIMAAADILVAPYTRQRNERLGLSPLKIRDYAAMGRPVVATRLGGIDDLDGQPWIELAEPEEPAALEAALVSMLARDPVEIGNAARLFAVENLSWKAIAARVSDLILEASEAP